MWFDDFAQKARTEVYRWLQRLEDEGVETLRKSYDSIGNAELESFAKDHEAFVDRLLRARSDKERERILAAAPDQSSRHALLLSACWQARYGLAWVEGARGRSLEPSPGESDRDVCANAASAARYILAVDVSMWPFDDYDPLDDDFD